jgi:hypothetical protein
MGPEKGQTERQLRQSTAPDALGGGVHVGFHPGGVGIVVVIADLQQHRGEVGLAHLAQRRWWTVMRTLFGRG